MISTKCIAVLFLAAFALVSIFKYDIINVRNSLIAFTALLVFQAQQSDVMQPEENARQEAAAATASPTIPPTLPPSQHWTEQMRVAVHGATERMSQNMVVVLSALSETMRDAGYNNTRAFGKMII